MRFGQGNQTIKTQEDRRPVYIKRVTDPSTTHEQLQVIGDSDCSWIKDDKQFGPETFRPRIEPWLTALVQSDHLSLLVGSGLTHAVHRMATGEALRGMDRIVFDVFEDEIKVGAKKIAKEAKRQCGNFEDTIRVANELLRGLEILVSVNSDKAPNILDAVDLRVNLKDAINSFANSILEGERNLIFTCPEMREKAFNHLVSFLMSFASRAGIRERLHIFTTNYDRYIEAGADVAGLHLIDRFVGKVAPVFRSSRLDIDFHYNPPGIRGEPRYLEGVARFTKLHGSVDWVYCKGQIQRAGLPFGALATKPYLAAPTFENADAMQIMIYPNAAKDRETASYPYIELFRDFASAICRPNSTLICYGYSFGDEHINRVIEDMLTIPSAHLVIISFDDPLGRITELYERLGRHAQVTLLIGDHLADLETLVRHYLPKPAIDLTTVRMADLLQTRWSIGDGERGTSRYDEGNEGNVEQ